MAEWFFRREQGCCAWLGRGPGKRSERRSRHKAICPNAMRFFWKVAAFRLTDSIRIQSGRRALRCFQNELHHFIILNLKWYYPDETNTSDDVICFLTKRRSCNLLKDQINEKPETKPTAILPGHLTTERSDILQFEKRWVPGSVVFEKCMECSAMPFSRPDPFLPGTHRALVFLRSLLNNLQNTLCIRTNPITPCYLTNYIRSAETGEIFGLDHDYDARRVDRIASARYSPVWHQRREAGS